MSKSWTDRADRDLFFAILTHKQLGVISGADWAVIGRDLRARGYGFTNEGCRQHFQGLRRRRGCVPEDGAQGGGAPGVGDPNPVTRRPGKRRAEAGGTTEGTDGTDRTDRTDGPSGQELRLEQREDAGDEQGEAVRGEGEEMREDVASEGTRKRRKLGDEDDDDDDHHDDDDNNHNNHSRGHLYESV